MAEEIRLIPNKSVHVYKTVKVYYKPAEWLRLTERAQKMQYSSLSLYLKRMEEANSYLPQIEAFKEFRCALYKLVALLK